LARLARILDHPYRAQTKVGDLEHAAGIEKDILWFQVTMRNPLLVYVILQGVMRNSVGQQA
jgi:hypothetical protein